MRAAALALLVLLVVPAALPFAPAAPPAAGGFPDGPPNDPAYDRAEEDPLRYTIFDEQWNLFGFTPRSTPLAAPEGASGISADRAWRTTIGRPDVRIAVLDSGIKWETRDLLAKMALNTGELPMPQGCAAHDCDGDGAVTVRDYASDPRAGDRNGNGVLDAGDLIRAFRDGVDQDGNAYVDDISGWDFWRGDEDADDDVRFGHGTGEALGSAAETDNGLDGAGVCPRCMVVPLRIGDSFVVHAQEFALAVAYAADNGIDVVQAAIGSVNWDEATQAALDYAWARGTLVVLSAADEDSFHHNQPGALNHALVTKSVVPDTEDAPWVPLTRAAETTTYQQHAACTNWGGRMHLATPSGSCSSGATEILAGTAGLLKSRAKELGLDLSPAQLKQVLTLAADDIHHPESVLGQASLRYPSQPGWDPYFGYGRTNASRAVELLQVPLHRDYPILTADIVAPMWFEPIVWREGLVVPVVGSAGHPESPGGYYTVEVARGLSPKDGDFERIARVDLAQGWAEGVLAEWRPPEPPAGPAAGPDDFTWTLRVRANDNFGPQAEDRKTVAVYRDATLEAQAYLGASIEGSPALADLDGDGRADIVVADGGGRVHALRADGAPLLGWPVATDVLDEAARHAAAPAFASGAVPLPRDGFVGSVAVGNLRGDGRPVVVAATLGGKVYAWDADGARVPGFPVAADRALADDPHQRNRVRWGFLGTPALADLDGDGALEVVVGGYDQHLHVWRADGARQPGFPVKLRDAAMAGQFKEGNKVTSAPAVADLDGDGRPDIVVGTNEVYREPKPLQGALQPLLDTGSGRVYAVHGDGDLHPGGPFLAGWPVRPTSVLPRALPLVGSGVPMSPSVLLLAGQPKVAVSAFAGDILVYHGNGTVWKALASPPLGGSGEATGLPTVANGAWGDLDGLDGPEYVLGLTGVRAAVRFAQQGKRLDWQTEVAAWSPQVSEAVRPGWPKPIEDWMFFVQPAIGDVDGNPATQEVVTGSGGYLVWAWDALGQRPLDGPPPALSTWPKFTGGWVTASPAIGDVDGDGRNEVVLSTREGFVFVWGTPGTAAPHWPMLKAGPGRTGVRG